MKLLNKDELTKITIEINKRFAIPLALADELET